MACNWLWFCEATQLQNLHKLFGIFEQMIAIFVSIGNYI